MYKGTYDGDIDEIKFVAEFNADKIRFNDYLCLFSKYTNLYMIRVTSKQISKLSNKKVFTRADCYLANISTDISHILNQNDYYLSEEILDKNCISYEKIPFSGVSVKITTSKNFQILKMTPNSFNTLFGSHELGAGASLFCMRENELNKNQALINGWNTSFSSMATYFKEFTNNEETFYLHKEICKNIKQFSCKEIKNIINNSHELQQKIFNGVDLYKEPYTAFYFYHGYEILKLNTIDFNVTTGSGRSKGDYAIVLKPN